MSHGLGPAMSAQQLPSIQRWIRAVLESTSVCSELPIPSVQHGSLILTEIIFLKTYRPTVQIVSFKIESYHIYLAQTCIMNPRAVQ